MIKYYQDNRHTFLRVSFTAPTCFTTYQPQVYLKYHVRTHMVITSLLYFKASNDMLMHAATAAAADGDDDDSNAL